MLLCGCAKNQTPLYYFWWKFQIWYWSFGVEMHHKISQGLCNQNLNPIFEIYQFLIKQPKCVYPDRKQWDMSISHRLLRVQICKWGHHSLAAVHIGYQLRSIDGDLQYKNSQLFITLNKRDYLDDACLVCWIKALPTYLYLTVVNFIMARIWFMPRHQHCILSCG